jgi:hypothetical protein
MKSFRAALTAAVIVAAFGSVSPAHSSQDTPKPAEAAANLAGLHDFDFLVGQWRVHHRRLKERLADSRAWFEFDGTLENRKLMEGWANVGENLFDMPGDAYRGVGLRSYDPKTGQWASWWLDGRDPFGALDPPAKGRFEKGIGTFYADSTFKGKPIRVRVVWSRITPSSARWEQSFSADGGNTWELNWVSDFQRVK